MIFSMTGYAAVNQETPHGSFSIEIRSVNNRYLDILFRLPDEFRKQEAVMRELLTTQLRRGKVECRLNFSPSTGTVNLPQLDHALLEQLLQLEQAVKTRHAVAASLTVAEILKWPGILGSNHASIEEFDEITVMLLQTALNDLKTARIREGNKLKSILLNRIEQMRQLLQIASPRIPALIAAFEEKLLAWWEEILGDF